MRKFPSRRRLRVLRRAALGLGILVAAGAALRPGAADAAASAVRAPAGSTADASAATSPEANAADTGGAAGAERSAHTRGSTLTAAGPDSPKTFLATSGIALEPVSEREGPQARMRVRGLRVIRGAHRLRLALNPDAPRVRRREQAHLDALPALVRARAGILPSRGTSRPPPSHSS